MLLMTSVMTSQGGKSVDIGDELFSMFGVRWMMAFSRSSPQSVRGVPARVIFLRSCGLAVLPNGLMNFQGIKAIWSTQLGHPGDKTIIIVEEELGLHMVSST